MAKKKQVRIKQATKQGFIYCNIGGVFNAQYLTSKIRRGRVIQNGEVSPTIQCDGNSIMRVEEVDERDSDDI